MDFKNWQCLFICPFFKNLSTLLQIFIFFKEAKSNEIFHYHFMIITEECGRWNPMNTNTFWHPFREAIIFLWIGFVGQINFWFWKQNELVFFWNFIIKNNSHPMVTNLRQGKIHPVAKSASFQPISESSSYNLVSISTLRAMNENSIRVNCSISVDLQTW